MRCLRVQEFKKLTNLETRYLKYTAPHQPRKKREITGAVALLKTKYGGGIKAHRLLSTPLTLSANVFTSLVRRQFPGITNTRK